MLPANQDNEYGYKQKGLALTYKHLEDNIARYQEHKVAQQPSSSSVEDLMQPVAKDANDLMFATEIDPEPL